jgi:UDP-glucuronate 4-epimerase
MKVLVTGAAGFIGYSLIARLLARGDTVIGVDMVNAYYDVRLKEARIGRLKEAGGNRFTFLRQDFSDYAGLVESLKGLEFDRIVHLGAQAGVRYSIENPHAYLSSNLAGHLNLLGSGGIGAWRTWSMPPPPRSMAATPSCPSASMTGSISRSASMRPPRRPTS